jgi:hypothetical protein
MLNSRPRQPAAATTRFLFLTRLVRPDEFNTNDPALGIEVGDHYLAPNRGPDLSTADRFHVLETHIAGFTGDVDLLTAAAA